MAAPRQRCAGCGFANRAIARFCANCGQVFAGGVGALPPGMALGQGGRYRIEHLLGKGGFGEAYLAHDNALERRCVVKRLAPSFALNEQQRAEVQSLFAHEARLLVTLNTPGHPAIPEIYEYLPEAQALVMKYIEGPSLAFELEQRGSFPEHEVLRIGQAIGAALVYLHARSPEPVLHRDIKPANILRGSDGRLWLIDFGLARGLPLAALAEGRLSSAAGTPGFTPREQWLGRAEPRSDVYALAATLAILLTNQTPQELGNGPMDVRRYAPEVRPVTAALLQRGLAPDLAARPNAGEFLAALERLLIADFVAPPAVPALPQLDLLLGRDEALAALAATLASAELTVITGLAGIGKTSIALALAHRLAAEEQQRLFWYSFRQGEGIDALIWALASFLAWHGQDDLWRLLHTAQQRGGQLPPPEALIDAALALARAQGYVLCLDDVQFAADDRLLERLIAGLRHVGQAGGAAVIVTSRGTPSFARQSDAVMTLDGLPAAAAREVLARRAVLLPEAQFAALYAATEGNPQLLMLAAEALRQSASAERLIARLAEAPSIERYLLQEVDAQLSEAERAVMVAAAMLLGRSGTRAAIEALLDGQSVRRELAALTQRRLLVRVEDDNGYAQHAIVRAFYHGQPSARERQALHRRAAAFYMAEDEPLLAALHHEQARDYAEAARLATSDIWRLVNAGQAQALERLLAQLSEQALGGEVLLALLLARGEVAGVLQLREAAKASYQRALALLPSLGDAAQEQRWYAQACHGLGNLYRFEAPSEAQRWYRRGLEALAADMGLQAAVLRVGLGATLFASGAVAEAGRVLEESLALLPASEPYWRANALANLGLLSCEQGKSALGQRYYQQALALYEQLGDAFGQMTIWHNLGIEAQIEGDWPQALGHYGHAISLAENLGLDADRTESELALGIVQINCGDDEAAAMHLISAVDLARRYELREQLADALLSYADLELRRGDTAAALPLWVEAAQLVEQLDTRSQLAEVLLIEAQLQQAQSQAEAAAATAERSITVAQDLDQPLDQGNALRVRGQALAASGQFADAQAAFEASLALLDGLDPYEAARTRAAWGLALRDHGDPSRAEALLGAALDAFEHLGAHRDHERAAQALERLQIRPSPPPLRGTPSSTAVGEGARG